LGKSFIKGALVALTFPRHAQLDRCAEDYRESAFGHVYSSILLPSRYLDKEIRETTHLARAGRKKPKGENPS
jgi:hypothetical protein